MDYWESDEVAGALRDGFLLSVRGRITLRLLEHWGVVAGKLGGEDSQGRSQIDLQSPQELVERAFTIADLTVDQLEARGWIRAASISMEDAAARSGELERIRMDRSFAARADAISKRDAAPVKE